MLRPLVLLCAAAVALVPAVRAADPQAPAQPPAAQPAANAQAQLPTVINLPGDALRQPQPGPDAKNLPTVINLAPAARPGDRQANAPTTRGYTLVVPTEGAILSTPYLAPYGGVLPGPYDYGIGAMYGPTFGFGYGSLMGGYDYAFPSYPFGYVPAGYSLGYTTAYAFWAQPQPLPTDIVSPAGRLSYMGNPGVVWGSGVFYHR
jgi:hypothetical protein